MRVSPSISVSFAITFTVTGVLYSVEAVSGFAIGLWFAASVEKFTQLEFTSFQVPVFPSSVFPVIRTW